MHSQHSAEPIGSFTAPTAPASTTPKARCLNCDAPLANAYCGACGQPAVDLAAPTWKVIRHAVTDAFDLDGRILQTARALLSPGRITLEFLRGRRAPYVGPLKLFLSAGAVLSATWLLTRGVDAHYYGMKVLDSAPTYIDAVVRGLLVSSITIAILNWLLSLTRRRFLDEVVFAVHVVAVLALWAAAVVWIGTIWKLAWGTVDNEPRGLPSVVHLVFAPAAVAGLGYFATAIRAVHRVAWWAAVLRALVLGAVVLAVVTAAILRGPAF